jgi:DNA polymerase type B, organellar and viral
METETATAVETILTQQQQQAMQDEVLSTNKSFSSNQLLSCAQCSKLFVSKYTLQVHIREHHPNQPEGDGRSFYCSHCKLVFSSRSRFIRHEQTKKHLKLISLSIEQTGSGIYHPVGQHVNNVIETSMSSFASSSRSSSPLRFPFPSNQYSVDNSNSSRPASPANVEANFVYDENAVLNNVHVNEPETDSIRTSPVFSNRRFGYEIEFRTTRADNSSIPNIFDYYQGQLLQLLMNLITVHGHVMYEVLLDGQYRKIMFHTAPDYDEETTGHYVKTDEIVELYPRTGFTNLYLGSNVEEELKLIVLSLLESHEMIKIKGSGYCLDHISLITVRVFPLDFTIGQYIETPAEFQKTRAIINVRNENDNQCLKYSILAGLHPDLKNKERVHSYRNYMHTLDFSGTCSPPCIDDFDRIEVQNSIRLNAFIIFDGELVPFKLSKQEEKETWPEIDLLLLYAPLPDGGLKYHWTCINSLNRLLRHKKGNESQVHICRRCFTICTHANTLVNHKKLCKTRPVYRVKMPAEHKAVLHFSKGYQTLQVPHFIVFDFESYLEPVNIPSPSGKSRKVKKHSPIAVVYAVVNEQNQLLDPPYYYAGEDCVEHFFERMFVEEARIMAIRAAANNRLIVTPEIVTQKETATHCYLCKKSFASHDHFGNPLVKVFDHDHMLPALPAGNNFRGIACSSCNIKFAVSKKIPVICHNGKGYDFKLLAGKIPLERLKIEKRELRLIGKSTEELIGFSIGNLEFKDSLQFAPESLSTLADLLHDDEFRILRSVYPDEKQFRACRKKQFFPYNYLDKPDKLSSKPLLPPRSEFFNDLTQKNISETEYEELKVTLTELGLDLTNDFFESYVEMYVTLDCLLLCDVICNLRASVWENYHLEMLNFVSNPGLSEAACLKMTNTRLELLTDSEMYLWFQTSCRGGIVQSPVRYSEANNSEMGDRFDASKPVKWISMVDIVNLYGSTMCQYPHGYGNFQWMTATELAEFDISQYDEFGNVGYLLCTNWKIDPAKHDYFSTFCPFPQKMIITENMLSRYHKTMLSRYQQKLGKPERLVCTLQDQENYLMSATVAKFYKEELGLHLVSVTGGIKYSQSRWLAPYIAMNTALRQSATSDFQRKYFKSLNNSLFGRTLMDTSRFRDFTLISTAQELRQRLGNPLFKNYTKLGENVVMIEMARKCVLQNRPIYLGANILDISKIYLYRFVYQTLMNALSSIGLSHKNLLINYTDTDSICFTVINVKNIYTDLYAKFRDQLDTSDFPTTHVIYSSANRKVPGKFTIETKQHTIEYIAVLASKAYAIKLFDHEQSSSGSSNSSNNGSNVMKVKAIPRREIVSKLTPADFKHALLSSALTHSIFDPQQAASGLANMKECEFYHFRSAKQQIYTCKTKRRCLYPNDLKAFILDDGITCLPYFHSKLMMKSEMDIDEED